MKKFLYSMMALMVAMTASVAMVSCGGDDDDENNAAGIDSRLVGTWYNFIDDYKEYKDGVLCIHWKDLSDTETYLYEIENGKETGEYKITKRDDFTWNEVVFNGDGTFTEQTYLGETDRMLYGSGTFTTADNILTVTNGDGVHQASYQFVDGQLLVFNEHVDGEWTSKSISYYNKGAYPNK